MRLVAEAEWLWRGCGGLYQWTSGLLWQTDVPNERPSQWTSYRSKIAAVIMALEACDDRRGRSPSLPEITRLAAIAVSTMGSVERLPDGCDLFLVDEAQVAPSVISVPADRRPTC